MSVAAITRNDLAPSRRAVLAGLAAAPALTALTAAPALADEPGAVPRLAALEARTGGRIGAALLDTATGRAVRHRADERFPLCSTFKLLAASLMLHRADAGAERLDRRIAFGPDQIVPYSPVTERRTGPGGMTVAEVCHAAVTTSDNTAGNLMLASFGGPPELTRFMRGLGDATTRLDRVEPELNDVPAGDERDTTAPGAMLAAMRRLLVDDALSGPSRALLQDWLVASVTGDARIRAGAPGGWRIGDKTGTGLRGAASDVAILWPKPGRPPLLLAVYLDGSSQPTSGLNAAIRDAARIMIEAVGAA
ncbi:class A beta-lactamase [Enterovirga sp.]|uniref:class A beta-lactamase n=1 Tax=Enterovirga sp. TaxID=2026350 RepID=UPI002633250F|nr:class A beta-lactamase [Enterovirga sp.]MDB5591567.1 penA [Enterovirga sp.]